MSVNLRVALLALVALVVPLFPTGPALADGGVPSATVDAAQVIARTSFAVELGFYVGVTPEATPSQKLTVRAQVQTVLGTDQQLLVDLARSGTVSTLQDEQAFTAFITTVDAVTALQASWAQQRQAFADQHGGQHTPASDRAWALGRAVFAAGCADGTLPQQVCKAKA